MRKYFALPCTVALVLASILVGVSATAASPSGGLDASPRRVNFGAVPVSTSSSTAEVTFTNTTGTNLSLGGPTVTDTDFATVAGSPDNCGASLGPGGSCEVGVVFTPQSSGHKSGDLHMPWKIAACVSDPSCWTTVSVRLSGRGT